MWAVSTLISSFSREVMGRKEHQESSGGQVEPEPERRTLVPAPLPNVADRQDARANDPHDEHQRLCRASDP